MFVFDKITQLVNTDNVFLAFLHNDETCKSSFRLLSISTPSIFFSNFPDFRLSDRWPNIFVFMSRS